MRGPTDRTPRVLSGDAGRALREFGLVPTALEIAGSIPVARSGLFLSTLIPFVGAVGHVVKPSGPIHHERLPGVLRVRLPPAPVTFSKTQVQTQV